jgi:hypothetical protein
LKEFRTVLKADIKATEKTAIIRIAMIIILIFIIFLAEDLGARAVCREFAEKCFIEKSSQDKKLRRNQSNDGKYTKTTCTIFFYKHIASNMLYNRLETA